MRLAHRPRLRSLFQLLIFFAGCVCLSLLALLPLATGKLPQTADGLLHLHRGVALEHALRVDQPLWNRYASSLAYGYGAPLFHYFPPLAYYPMTWLHQIGFSFVDGWLLSLSLFTLLAAAGVLVLARRWSGAGLAGWVAALAYVNSPYALFNSLTRGALAEVAALAVLPWVIWAFTRLSDSGGRRDIALAVLIFALFIPLHTLITLHGAGLLLVICLFLLWRARDRRAVFSRLLLAFGLALAISAFYWLPALVESDQIKLGLIREQLSHIEPTRHLRPVSDIFAPPHQADPTQQNQAVPISLGLAQMALAVIGVALSMRRANRALRPLMALLCLLTLGYVFMNTPTSAPLWRSIPLIGYTQFPWRLLGLASMLLACMTGMGALMLWRALPAGTWRWLLLSGIVIVLSLYGLPWSFTAYHDAIEASDMRDAQRFERESGKAALGSYTEYLPRTADLALLDPLRLAGRYAESDVIARLEASDSLTIEAATWHGTGAELRLSSKTAQTLVFDWLYVPGWRATLDGRSLAVSPSPAGLVALDAPAGEFELNLRLQPTTIQSVAGIISGIGASVLIALLLWRRTSESANGTGSVPLDWRIAAVGIALCIGVSLYRAALEGSDSPFKSARFGDVTIAPAAANFDKRIDLLHVDFPADAITEPKVEVKLSWRLHDKPLEQDYASIIRMRDSANHIIAEGSSFAPGGLATSNWGRGMHIEDKIHLRIPPFTAPLDDGYSFELSLFDIETLAGLSLINAAGDPQSVAYALGSRLYRPSAATRDLERAHLPAPSRDRDLPVQLIEAPVLPASATVGDELRFSWTWRLLDESDRDLGARLLWLDENGVAASVDMPQIVTGYGTDRWGVGEVNRGHHSAVLPPELPAGDYALALGLLDMYSQEIGAIIPLSETMTVSAPIREYNAPGFVTTDVARWNNGIALAGYRIDEAGGLELAWRTGRQLDESLRLFLHALDADGRIAAQWDGVPADWTRPTTGWLPGEFVRTRHQFDLLPGAYGLRLGWYLPETAERIGIGASDSLILFDELVVG